MIASLTGRLKRKEDDYLIVDVSGVGYQVQVPLSTYTNLPEAGEEVNLLIHTHVREDSLTLFGFLTQAEKELFLILLGVSGIGPKLALSILSGLSVEDLCSAICSSDDSKLCAIPGIGKKTAARMSLELKDKIKHFFSTRLEPGRTSLPSSEIEDAISALVNLGYRRPLAEEAVRKVRQNRTDLDVEKMIRDALQVLTKK